MDATLPLYRSAHKYRGKTVVFEKPLFPGYVFLSLREQQRTAVLESNCVANLLFVTNQDLFSKQLQEILAAIESGLELHSAPVIDLGARVKIKHGPLQGFEGCVEERQGNSFVLLRLDFIGRAAAIKMNADDLELVA